ncbi:MAG TPA: MFS transporter [Bryobacteraceae bacterium]|nr:MFS transporter [Bryobacteraceae bacterium]
MNPTLAPRPALSRFRWVVCSLLFFATVIAYVDRGVLAYLEQTLERIIGFDKEQYSYMTAAFQAAYAIGLVSAGRLTDRLGTRRGFAIAITLWSVAAMLPGLATSVLTFGFAMFFLGLGEAANFPACIKTVAEWFPKKERALATGMFNSGANIGAIVVPAVVPFLALTFGWRGAFIATGALGFVWLASWLLLYDKPETDKHISAAELAYIRSDPPEKIEAVPWVRILPLRETWAFAVAKFFSDPIWWFYLFWLAPYLQETFHLDIKQNRLPVIVAYALSCIGSVAGGWLSGFLLKRGVTVNVARKTALLICALAVLPVLYAPYSHNLWVVVALVGLAMAAHQGWSANLFTLPSDMFPRAAVASVVGFGGMVGSVGGVLMQLGAGRIVQATHSYLPLFLIAGSAYLVGLGIVQLLTPRLAPAKLD